MRDLFGHLESDDQNTDQSTNKDPKSYKYLAQIAIEQSIDLSRDGLTYGVPEHLEGIKPGQRVWVPLGRKNQLVLGFTTSIEPSAAAKDLPKRLKAIDSLDEQGLSLPEDLIELGKWIASYYITPLGMVLACMLPAAVKKGVGLKKKIWYRLIDPPKHGEVTDIAELKLSKLGKKAIEVLAAPNQTQSGWMESHALINAIGAKTASPLQRLIKKGLIEKENAYALPATIPQKLISNAPQKPNTSFTIDTSRKHQLSAQQKACLTKLNHALDQFKVSLLFGVTGSGKTEVYLQLIEAVLRRGQSAIILVPEIALTPQTAGRFTRRFQGVTEVAVLHSGLKASQRQSEWRRIQSGSIRLIIGARSAVMAPAQDLGLIVVDEEHDSSYKQDQLPRYHARDVAIRRAQMLNKPVLLGSATPSLESYANCQKHPKHYQMLTMDERVGGASLPHVNIVDLAEDRRERAKRKKEGSSSSSSRTSSSSWTASSWTSWHLLSLPLEQALHQAFQSGHQAMLLLNRRGYANYIACPDQFCGWSMRCDHCDASMVYHRQQKFSDSMDEIAQLANLTKGQMRCHHCGAEAIMPRLCPACGKKLTVFGLGTQRVEEEIKAKFPQIRMARMDSDTMRDLSDYEKQLSDFRDGHSQLLLGTQMIAKGLDFPNVTVVGVISSDTALNLPDFRAAERTYQLISQVAGRAGRGKLKGQVYLQTFAPDDPTIQLASQTKFSEFAEREINFRQNSGHPPSSRMVRMVVRDLDREKAEKRASQLRGQMDSVIGYHAKVNPGLFEGLKIVGPGACAIDRIAEFHRFEMLLFSPSAGALQQLLTSLRQQFKVKSDHGLAIDVDPVGLL